MWLNTWKGLLFVLSCQPHRTGYQLETGWPTLLAAGKTENIAAHKIKSNAPTGTVFKYSQFTFITKHLFVLVSCLIPIM